MNTIYVKTQKWMYDYAADEVESLTEYDLKDLTDEIFEVKVKDDLEVFEFVFKLAYYSRTIEHIYLKVEPQNNYLAMPKLNMKLKDKNIEVFDLVGFNLFNREFRLNTNADSINSSVINYCFHLMELDLEEDKFSVIDPLANYGEVIIEASLLTPRKPLNVKSRNEINIYKALKERSQIPTSDEDRNKYVGIVQNDTEFSKLKENINHSSQKIKTSKFELEWLDSKFKGEEFDYVVTSFPLFKDEKYKAEFIDQFFYQAAFIFKKLIGVISREKIDEKLIKKHKLDISDYEEIVYGEVTYYVYVLE